MKYKIEMIAMTCDNCEKDYKESATDFAAFIDEAAVAESSQEDGWIEHEGNDFCEDCHYYDVADVLILKPNPKKIK